RTSPSRSSTLVRRSSMSFTSRALRGSALRRSARAEDTAITRRKPRSPSTTASHTWGRAPGPSRRDLGPNRRSEPIRAGERTGSCQRALPQHLPDAAGILLGKAAGLGVAPRLGPAMSDRLLRIGEDEDPA